VKRFLKRTKLFYREKRKWQLKAKRKDVDSPFASLKVTKSDFNQTSSAAVKETHENVEKNKCLSPNVRVDGTSPKADPEEKSSSAVALKTGKEVIQPVKKAPKIKDAQTIPIVKPAHVLHVDHIHSASLKQQSNVQNKVAYAEEKETPRPWVCPICTFLNEPHHLTCSMCCTEKPHKPINVEKPLTPQLQQEMIDDTNSNDRERRSARRKKQKNARLEEYYTNMLQKDLQLAMKLDRSESDLTSVHDSLKTDEEMGANQLDQLQSPEKDLLKDDSPEPKGVFDILIPSLKTPEIKMEKLHEPKSLKMKPKKVFLRLDKESPRVQVNSWKPRQKILDRLRKDRMRTATRSKQVKIEHFHGTRQNVRRSKVGKRPDIDLSGSTEEEATSDWEDPPKRRKRRRSQSGTLV